MMSAMGVAISEAISLDFQLRNHVTKSDEDITIYEFAILQTLHNERSKWEEEQAKNPER